MNGMDVICNACLKGFAGKIGRGNAISAAEIADKLRQAGYETRTGIKITGITIREAVHTLRSNDAFNNYPVSNGGYFLISDTSSGYWLSNDRAEIKKWYLGYSGRVAKMLPVINIVQARFGQQ